MPFHPRHLTADCAQSPSGNNSKCGPEKPTEKKSVETIRYALFPVGISWTAELRTSADLFDKVPFTAQDESEIAYHARNDATLRR